MNVRKQNHIRMSVQGLFDRSVDFASIVNHMPVGVILLDLEQRVVFMNQAIGALTGFTNEEARGIACKHILRSNLCGHRCPFLGLSKSSEPICREGNIVNRDREKIPVRILFAPLLDELGNLAGWMETVEDMRSVKARETEMGEAFSMGSLLGRSPQMEKVFRIVPGIAQTDSSVLITGETGTGKDLLAELIHQQSARSKGPFVKVNCGALPETLLESELFGHRKGAFTGATEHKQGRFRLAHNGTLFLTEIGDLPLALQVKLLSFLDDQVVYPLGSGQGIQVNVRIIAATHHNLQQMVQGGRFRQDLFYRLNVVRVHIPALREREGDIQLLLDYFLHYYSRKFGKSISGFSRDALAYLKDFSFPGNVRELKNIVEFAVNICPEGKIQPDHLPDAFQETTDEQQKAESVPHAAPFAQDAVDAKEVANWEEMEREMILLALMRAGGKRKEAAAILGWGRSTLWRKMKQYNISS